MNSEYDEVIFSQENPWQLPIVVFPALDLIIKGASITELLNE